VILQINNAIGKDDCRHIMELYDGCAHLSKEVDYSGHPVLHWCHLQEFTGADALFPRLARDCLDKIAMSGIFHPALFPETLILATMGVGGLHPKHADNCTQDEQGNWVQNHTPHRDVSAIYYLNDEFEGGEIIFDRQGLRIKPRQGLLIAFPSDAEHEHEVLPVLSGRRYTMPIWFTKQKAFMLADFAD
jgi:predicted 2-oxoglutarate/Fe(II)-dependent dioxygenase YbiX